MVSTLASGPSCPGFNTQHSQNIFRGKNVNVPDANQWCFFEESEQWLENVDQTHLVLSSGKLVQKKKSYQLIFLTLVFQVRVKLDNFLKVKILPFSVLRSHVFFLFMGFEFSAQKEERRGRKKVDLVLLGLLKLLQMKLNASFYGPK